MLGYRDILKLLTKQDYLSSRREFYLDPQIPKEVEETWKLCGMSREDMIRLHREGVISFQTKAETRKQLEAVIKKLEAQS